MQLFLPLHPEYVGVLSNFCSSYPLLYHIIILRLLISRTSIVYFKSLTTWSVLSLANYILGLKFASSVLLPTCISVQFSHSVMSDSLRPHESQHAKPPCPSPTPGVHSDPRPSRVSDGRVSDAIQPSHPLSSPSPPAPNPSQHQSLFQWVISLHEVAKVLEFQL